MQGPVRGVAVLGALGSADARSAGAARGVGGPGTMLDPAVAVQRDASGFPDLTRREIAVLTPLIVLIIVLGFFPGPVLDVINPSVTATLHEVGLTDPVGGMSR
jgi:NADH-quinone oxidoreductase subunit M